MKLLMSVVLASSLVLAFPGCKTMRTVGEWLSPDPCGDLDNSKPCDKPEPSHYPPPLGRNGNEAD